jgi:hypothetical protein
MTGWSVSYAMIVAIASVEFNVFIPVKAVWVDVMP